MQHGEHDAGPHGAHPPLEDSQVVQLEPQGHGSGEHQPVDGVPLHEMEEHHLVHHHHDPQLEAAQLAADAAAYHQQAVEYQYYQQEHYQHHGGEHQVHSEGESEEVDPLAETGLFIPGTEVNGECATGGPHLQIGTRGVVSGCPVPWLPSTAGHLLRLLLPPGVAAWQHPPPCPAACPLRPSPEP